MDFRNSSRNKRIEHWIIVILISSLCMGLNFFVSKLTWQIDLSKETKYSLSRESLALLNKLEEPVEIIVTIKEKNNFEFIYILSEDSQPGRSCCKCLLYSSCFLINFYFYWIYYRQQFWFFSIRAYCRSNFWFSSWFLSTFQNIYLEAE